ATMLATAGGYEVVVGDRDAGRFAMIEPHPAVSTRTVDIANKAELASLLEGCFAVLSAAPFHLTTVIGDTAAALGVHYLDLTEDVAS
ncbi:saccharopine dehydrogenase NADP-binding domain-containing protein, partial [Escherichia coli]|uniref:saccharopine dehydrogenase NADP-binding domain-containing protein n=1 Tax=Escherichia coli TaxID=562 RepID=UPI0028DF7ECA